MYSIYTPSSGIRTYTKNVNKISIFCVCSNSWQRCVYMYTWLAKNRIWFSFYPWNFLILSTICTIQSIQYSLLLWRFIVFVSSRDQWMNYVWIIIYIIIIYYYNYYYLKRLAMQDWEWATSTLSVLIPQPHNTTP